MHAPNRYDPINPGAITHLLHAARWCCSTLHFSVFIVPRRFNGNASAYARRAEDTEPDVHTDGSNNDTNTRTSERRGVMVVIAETQGSR